MPLSQTAQRIYQQLLRQQGKSQQPEDRSSALDRAGTTAGYQPRPPRVKGAPGAFNAQEATPAQPLWQKALGVIAWPFEKLSQHVFTPLSAMVQAGAYGGYKATEGMNPWETMKAYQPGGVARQLYDEWKAPGIDIPVPWRDEPWRLDTKAISEIPFFALPAFGVAGKLGKGAELAVKGTGMAGKVAELAVGAGRVAPVVRGVARAIEYSPLGLAEKGIGKVVTNATRTISSRVSKFTQTDGFYSFPSTDVIIGQRVRDDWQRRLAQWLGRKPALRGIIKGIGGEAALVRGTQEAEDRVIQGVLVAEEIQKIASSQMNIGISALNILHPDPVKMFGVDKVTRLATKVSRKKGFSSASLAIPDILESPHKYIFRDKRAPEYIKTLHELFDATEKSLKAEGVDIPKLTFDDLSHYVHRVVKGKRVDGKLVEARKGLGRIGAKQSFQKQRILEDAIDGIEAGLIYEDNPLLVFTSYARSAAKLISDKRLAEVINPLRTGTGRSPVFGAEAAIQHPAFFGGVFPKEVAERTETYFADRGFKPLAVASDISGAIRTMVAAADVSAPFIQLVPLMGRYPKIWAKAAATSYKTVAKPEIYNQYLAKNSSLLYERSLYGGYVGGFEYTEAMPLLRKLAGKAAGKPGETLIRQTYGRFEASFGAAGDIARNELWKAMKPMAKNTNDLYDIARHIDRMTGVMSTKGLGIGKTQREFESAFMFFASRYTRAGFALVTDVLKGGLTGNEARKSLSAMIGAGAVMYSGTMAVLGKSIDEIIDGFNPTTGRFMTVEVTDPFTGNKRHMGVGGMMTSLIRFAADIIATTANNPEDLFIPLRDGELNRLDNPFIRFMYSKSAPLTGFLNGMITGKNFFGEPFEDVGDYAAFLGQQVLPISVQSMLMEEGGLTLSNFLGEQIGLRTFPISGWEKRDILRDELAKQQYGMSWKELASPNGPGKLTQLQIEQNSPELQVFTEEARKYTARLGREEGETWNAWHEDGRAIEGRYQDAVKQASDEFNITLDGVAFKDKVNEAADIRRAMYDSRDRNPLYQEQKAYYAEPLDDKDRASMNLLDVARRDYYTMMYTGDMFDEFGNYDFDLAEKKEGEFVKQYGVNAREYIKEFSGAKWDEPGAFKAFREAKEVLKPYFAIERAIWSRYPPGLKEIHEKVLILERTNKNVANNILKQYPAIVQARDEISTMKKRLKENNPDVGRALSSFYSY